MQPVTRTVNVKTYDEFRDMLPSSGLFDMDDCVVEIWCPEDSDVSQIEKMVHLVESMVNVVDVRIGSRVEDLVSDDYHVNLIEENPNIRSRFKK